MIRMVQSSQKKEKKQNQRRIHKKNLQNSSIGSAKIAEIPFFNRSSINPFPMNIDAHSVEVNESQKKKKLLSICNSSFGVITRLKSLNKRN